MSACQVNVPVEPNSTPGHLKENLKWPNSQWLLVCSWQCPRSLGNPYEKGWIVTCGCTQPPTLSTIEVSRWFLNADLLFAGTASGFHPSRSSLLAKALGWAYHNQPRIHVKLPDLVWVHVEAWYGHIGTCCACQKIKWWCTVTSETIVRIGCLLMITIFDTCMIYIYIYHRALRETALDSKTTGVEATMHDFCTNDSMYLL